MSGMEVKMSEIKDSDGLVTHKELQQIIVYLREEQQRSEDRSSKQLESFLFELNASERRITQMLTKTADDITHLETELRAEIRQMQIQNNELATRRMIVGAVIAICFIIIFVGIIIQANSDADGLAGISFQIMHHVSPD